MLEWDAGPPPSIRDIFEEAPVAEYESLPERFRLAWGPMFYRGRLDGSARVLIIGQDPAASENVARRVMVGGAGQRVQRYLEKLGITRSYVIVNAILYSIFGQFDSEMNAFMRRQSVAGWRNKLLDALAGPNIEAVIGVGRAARFVIENWPGAAAFENRTFSLIHPTARPESLVLENWSSQLAAIASCITPDADGNRELAPYPGPGFRDEDVAPIPHRDLGFGMPRWMGRGNFAARFDPDEIPQAAVDSPTILLLSRGQLG